jgi:diguanylate cyclase (GGDEF)-like protein
MLDRPTLQTLVLDSLEEQIAVIDQEGTIIYVNRAWMKFGIENGLSSEIGGVGSNYLKVCHASDGSGDSLAGETAQGIRDVLSGKPASFYLEYPCHGPEERRWFMMRATTLQGDTSGLCVISHHNITQRRLAEERVEYLSLHDQLTGLSNRRHFDQFLDNEWRRCMRNRSPISIILIDIDYFKDYNDELGHLAGDQCLVKVSHALQAFSSRSSDLAVRYGGEEFALILGDTDHVVSLRIAEASRKAIHDLDIRYRGTKQITISAGAASMIPDKEQTEMFLVQQADKALYVAKQQGRNRVVHAQDIIGMQA